jgi:hydroxymethylbilane synthase
MNRVRIGTRGSPLALWQANFVAGALRQAHAGLVVELVEIQTAGDQIQNVPLASLGGDGLFTKAIQQALLDGRADLAVHSLKDLPTFAVEGLTLAAIPKRAPTGDALVSKKHASFNALPVGAVVATSSLRRRAQVLHRRPDLRLIDIRGNVETRLRKLVEQDLDATILAEAGLLRLNLAEHITEVLDASWMFPAVGQGALGLECRTEDSGVQRLLRPLDHVETRAAALAERAMLRALGGGCQTPIGALSTVRDGRLRLRGVVLPPNGERRTEGQVEGPITEAESLGTQLAQELAHAMPSN